MSAMKQLADSKKATLTIATMVIAGFLAAIGIEKDLILMIIGLGGSYNLGQGLADFGTARKENTG